MEPNQFQANNPSTSQGGVMDTSSISNLTPSDHSHKKIGPIVAILVIVVVLVVAVLYIFASRINKSADTITAPTTSASLETTNPQVNAPTQPAQTIPPTVAPVSSKATDVQSLQNDLKVSTNGLDSQTIGQ